MNPIIGTCCMKFKKINDVIHITLLYNSYTLIYKITFTS